MRIEVRFLTKQSVEFVANGRISVTEMDCGGKFKFRGKKPTKLINFVRKVRCEPVDKNARFEGNLTVCFFSLLLPPLLPRRKSKLGPTQSTWFDLQVLPPVVWVIAVVVVYHVHVHRVYGVYVFSQWKKITTEHNTRVWFFTRSCSVFPALPSQIKNYVFKLINILLRNKISN